MQCPILMVPRVLSCVKIMCFYQKVQWEPFHSCNREARIQRNTPTGVMPRVRCTQEAEQETVRTGVRVRGDRGPIPDFKSNLCRFGQVTSLLWFLRKREGQTKGHTTLSMTLSYRNTDKFSEFSSKKQKTQLLSGIKLLLPKSPKHTYFSVFSSSLKIPVIYMVGLIPVTWQKLY